MNLDDRNAVLEKKLEANPIDDQIATLVRADRRKRWHLLALTLMALALAYGWWQNHNLAIRAESNHDSIVRNCETGNEARSNNKKLWRYILEVPPTQPPTKEQQKRIAEFRKFVEMTFAPRDCSTL